MRIIFKSLGLAMLLAFAIKAPPAAAQTASAVLTVDIDRIYAQSAAGKSGQAQITAKYQPLVQGQETTFRSAAAAYNAQLEAARKAVGPNNTIPLPAANQKALGDAQQRALQARDAASQTQDEVNSVAAYVRDQILRAVVPLAEQVRAERHAMAVIPRGSALAADPSGDVTTVIVQRLDQSLKTVSIVLPQQSAAPPPGRPAASQGR